MFRLQLQQGSHWMAGAYPGMNLLTFFHGWLFRYPLFVCLLLATHSLYSMLLVQWDPHLGVYVVQPFQISDTFFLDMLMNVICVSRTLHTPIWILSFNLIEAGMYSTELLLNVFNFSISALSVCIILSLFSLFSCFYFSKFW